MVSFTPRHRLGNWLFKFAAAYAYAERYGLEFTVPLVTPDVHAHPIYFPHLAAGGYEQGRQKVVIKEQAFQFVAPEFRPNMRHKNIILDGAYQSERYFENYRDQVRSRLDLPWDPQDRISVHVRRGDYLTWNSSTVAPPEWYTRAMRMFPGRAFKFYSDEIDWCSAQWGHRDDCTFSTEVDPLADLVDASCSESNIGSCSTYSWWIAQLGRNDSAKVAVFPRPWFDPRGPLGWLDQSDIVPSRWISLD